MKIHFRELIKLSPTVISTVLKLVEEIGELSREMQRFDTTKYSLDDLLGELMDVAQTTATLVFVLEHQKKADIENAIALHIQKLKNKGYIQQAEMDSGGVFLQNGQLALFLPELSIDPDLTKTFLKLTEEAGELVQIIGKKSGLSGEINNLLTEDRKELELSLALLDIAQCCVTLLYIMTEKYSINVEDLINKHENKLKEHGYL